MAEGNHTVRLEPSGQNDDLDKLTETINRLLDQVQACHLAYDQSKEALREGHEQYRRLESNIPGMATHINLWQANMYSPMSMKIPGNYSVSNRKTSGVTAVFWPI